jgi:hypothetical protein
LFTSQLGFVQTGYSEFFEEVTLEKQLNEDTLRGNGQAGCRQQDGHMMASFETLALEEENLDF